LGTRARREKEKENMRLAILEAATKIIIEEGYDNLTMRKIAEAIEYTPTTIYSYYKDKAQIVDDISRVVYKKIVLSVKTALEEHKEVSVDQQLEIGFKAFIYTLTANAEMSKAVIRSGSRAIFGPDEEHEPPEDNGIMILHNLLLKGQQEFFFRKLDENISWMLVTALIGFSINVIENQLHFDENWHELVHIYVEMLIKGLQK